jgi:hypothetical protein
VLVAGGGEAVVVQAGRVERIHPLGRTIHMFWRLTQREQ